MFEVFFRQFQMTDIAQNEIHSSNFESLEPKNDFCQIFLLASGHSGASGPIPRDHL